MMYRSGNAGDKLDEMHQDPAAGDELVWESISRPGKRSGVDYRMLSQLEVFGTLLDGQCILNVQLPSEQPALKECLGSRSEQPVQDSAFGIVSNDFEDEYEYGSWPSALLPVATNLTESQAQQLALDLLDANFVTRPPNLQLHGTWSVDAVRGADEYVGGWTIQYDVAHNSVPLAIPGYTVYVRGDEVAHAILTAYQIDSEVGGSQQVISSTDATTIAAQDFINQYPTRACHVTEAGLYYAPVETLDDQLKFVPAWFISINDVENYLIDARDSSELAQWTDD